MDTALLLLVGLLLNFTFASAVGYMSTVASLWGVACSLSVDSLQPFCWGDNPFFKDNSPPVNVSFWAISGGGYSVCGLLSQTHYPLCWGQIGEVPRQYQNVRYSNINSGGWHACAVRDPSHPEKPGHVDCWGDNTIGQASPSTDAEMLMVTAGDLFTCGLKAADRKAICWGEDISSGEFAISAPENVSFEGIFAGRQHVCGIQEGAKKTICWGNNTYQQASPPTNYTFSKISGGYSFSCGLRSDTHEAVCWGDNSMSQLTARAGLPFAAISAGDFFTCGVREDIKMSLICFGKYNVRSPSMNLRASMGLCVQNCEDGQFELSDRALGVKSQCQGSSEKVCLDCYSNCVDKTCLTSLNSFNSRCPLLPAGAPSSAPSHHQDQVSRITLGIVLSISVLLIGILGFCIPYCWRKNLLSLCSGRRPAHATSRLPARNSWRTQVTRVVAFSSAALQDASHNYDNKMIIGKGNFGVVYKGNLSDGKIVAIKKATRQEKVISFETELQLLCRLHHAFIVNLVGYCQEENALVFEFMENGSLYDILFSKRKHLIKQLDWVTRLKIAMQTAIGLEYLHAYTYPPIIHRDVKTSNILLDENWNAHIADFGLSLHGPVDSQTHISNTTPAGTAGYLDPEYYQTFQLTPKSDVYSFGVVLLELLSGHQAIDFQQSDYSLVSWASELSENGTLSRLLDPTLETPNYLASGPLLKITKLALQCVRLTRKQRPTMTEVASILERTAMPLLDTSKKTFAETLSSKSLQKSESPSAAGSTSVTPSSTTMDPLLATGMLSSWSGENNTSSSASPNRISTTPVSKHESISNLSTDPEILSGPR